MALIKRLSREDCMKYFIDNGSICPYCEEGLKISSPITFDKSDRELAYQKVRCHECGKKWTDKYQLFEFGNKDESCLGKEMEERLYKERDTCPNCFSGLDISKPFKFDEHYREFAEHPILCKNCNETFIEIYQLLGPDEGEEEK